MIRIQPSAWFLTAALLLILPLEWFCAAILAAAVHELGHLAAIYALGEYVENISIGGFEARIHTRPLNNRAELLCAVSGPAASICLIVLCRFLPKVAFCGLAQGLFNLIPLYPMDGGRMLRCCLRRCFRQRADSVFRTMQYLILCSLLLIMLLWTVHEKAGILPVLVCVSILLRLLPSKTPCKTT